MPGYRLCIGDHVEHEFLQPFLARNLDELVQQTPAYPAVAIGRGYHLDFPDMLACASVEVVQGAITNDRAVQEREQWQDPTVVKDLGPPGDNGGVSHFLFQRKTVLWGNTAEKV
jgi:hypothetical protein